MRSHRVWCGVVGCLDETVTLALRPFSSRMDPKSLVVPVQTNPFAIMSHSAVRRPFAAFQSMLGESTTFFSGSVLPFSITIRYMCIEQMIGDAVSWFSFIHKGINQ